MKLQHINLKMEKINIRVRCTNFQIKDQIDKKYMVIVKMYLIVIFLMHSNFLHLDICLEQITIATNNDYGKSKNAGRDAAIKILIKLIKYFDPQKVQIKLPLLKDFGDMLEQQVEINKWVERKINPFKQVSKILENKRNIKDKKCVKILEDYLEKLNFESDVIS